MRVEELERSIKDYWRVSYIWNNDAGFYGHGCLTFKEAIRVLDKILETDSTSGKMREVSSILKDEIVLGERGKRRRAGAGYNY